MVDLTLDLQLRVDQIHLMSLTFGNFLHKGEVEIPLCPLNLPMFNWLYSYHWRSYRTSQMICEG